ncbi:MAG: alpha/beta hydrolase [Nanoarchaeota archaeon]
MYLEHKGYKLYCEKAGTRKSGTIFFLHGWLADSRFFSFARQSKLAENYELIYADYFGFGASDNPADESFHTIESFAEQAKAVADFFKIENPILVGHSMGGIVALEYSQKHPTKEIIMFGTPMKKNWMHSLYVFFAKYGLSRSIKALINSLLERNIPDEIKNSKTPIKLFYGEKDYWIRHDSELLKQLGAEKHIELIKMAGGHNALLSRRKMFGIALENFLLKPQS